MTNSWKSFWKGFGSVLNIGGNTHSNIMTDKKAFRHNRKALKMEDLTNELHDYISNNPEADLKDLFNFIKNFESKTRGKDNVQRRLKDLNR